jgi:hypothetical protein
MTQIDDTRAFRGVADVPERSRQLDMHAPAIGGLRGHALALLVFGAAGALAMLPVLAAPGKVIAGWLGDNVQYVYMTGWVAEALSRGISPFVDPRLNYPDSLALAATDAPFLNMVFVAPVAWLAGPVFAYNLLVFLSHVLSGFFAYLWIARITRSRFGGIVAGLAFLLAPYRVVHSYGHLQLVSTQFIPLFFWALDSALCDERPRLKRLLLLGVGTFLAGSGGAQYYLAFCLLAAPVYVVLMRPQIGYLVRHGWMLAASALAGAALAALPYLVGESQSAYVSYDLTELRFWSPDLYDFLAPSRLHPLWGAWIEQVYPRRTWIEHTLYLGVSIGLLALIGVTLRSGLGGPRRRAWVGVAVWGMLLALGTDLHVAGEPLRRENPVWLPAYYLVQFPFLDFVRVWARAAILPFLFLSLLAGVGAASLQRRLGSPLIPALCMALLVLELIPGRISGAELDLRPVDVWLAQQPGDFAVAFLPAGVDNYLAMYGSLYHEKRMPAYNHPTHRPVVFDRFAEATRDFPDAGAVAALRDLDVRYILLHRATYDGGTYPTWDAVQVGLAETPALRVVAEVDAFTVLEFAAP